MEWLKLIKGQKSGCQLTVSGWLLSSQYNVVSLTVFEKFDINVITTPGHYVAPQFAFGVGWGRFWLLQRSTRLCNRLTDSHTSKFHNLSNASAVKHNNAIHHLMFLVPHVYDTQFLNFMFFVLYILHLQQRCKKTIFTFFIYVTFFTFFNVFLF